VKEKIKLKRLFAIGDIHGCARELDTLLTAIAPRPSAMRFLHTADWQIGMVAAHVGAAGAHVHEERLRTAERVNVQKIGDILEGFGRPVFVITGNHNPLVPGIGGVEEFQRTEGDVHV
jgi:hypothetical protein